MSACRPAAHILALVAGLTLWGLAVQAATLTWTGVNGKWNYLNSGKANWGGTVFAAGDNAIFTGTNYPSPTIGTTALTCGSITFNNAAGAFTIDGTATLTITNGVVNNDADTQSFTVPIALGAAQTWNAASGNLSISGTVNNSGYLLTIDGANNTTISGVISGNGGLTKNGTGVATLSGTSANTFSGMTTVNDGRLELSKTAGLDALAGNLTIGDGSGAANSAELRLINDNQIPNGSAISILGDGLFSLNGKNETIGTLTMTAGSVTTGAGTLTLGGNVTGNASGSSATIGGNLNLGGSTRTFTIADGAAADDMSISAIISNGGLTKDGAGTLKLSGVNTYGSATTIKAGTVLAGGDAPSSGNGIFGNSSGGAVLLGDTTGSSSAALLMGGAYTVGRPVTVQSGSSGAATLSGNTDNNSTFSGLLTLNKSATITQVATTGGNALGFSGGITAGSAGTKTLTVDNVGTVTVSGTGISDGSGAIALVKQNSGTLNLNVASSYTGGTKLSGGAIALGADNALGGSSSGFEFAGGILNANNHSASIGALSLTANSTLNLSAGGSAGTLTFSSASWSGGTLTIYDWTGTAGHAGTDDRIFISGTVDPNATFLSHIAFFGFNDNNPGALWLGTGELAPIPEPAHYALALFGLVFVGVRAGRHYLARRRTA